MIELNVRLTWLPLLLGLACCGHREPEPFGKLSKEQLASWTSDCPVAVTDTPSAHDKQDPEAVTVGDRLAFAAATHRLRCEPSGWAVWLDANDRIAGLCTESYVDVSVTPSQIETATQRGEPILRRHFPASVVDDMVGGFCVTKPHEINHRLLRWQFEFPQRREHSDYACCWEVTK